MPTFPEGDHLCDKRLKRAWQSSFGMPAVRWFSNWDIQLTEASLIIKLAQHQRKIKWLYPDNVMKLKQSGYNNNLQLNDIVCAYGAMKNWPSLLSCESCSKPQTL